MELDFEPFNLTLHQPFTISRHTETTAYNVLIRLCDGDLIGLGEAGPAEHYGELQRTVLAYLETLRPQLEGTPLPITALHEVMDRVARLNPSAKAAVDMATYDLLGKRLGVPVYQLLGVDPSATPRTSFTIGIDTPEIMAQKATDAAQYPILKVKVGTRHDEDNLRAIRDARPDAVIRVDANEAWNAKEAVEQIDALQYFDIEFVEQPVPGHDLEGLGYVASATTLPIIADESCIIPKDVPRVAPYVDGINIKLMKCGGIYPALQMIHLARAHGLKIMMGCMIESAVAITAAAHLSPLIDYADLDGNLLVDDDPFAGQGVAVHDGKLILSDQPGLGISVPA